MTDLRAITIRPPWAQAIAEAADHPHDAKTIENRSAGFPKRYRGPLLIHAAKTWSTRGVRDPRIRHLFHCNLGQTPPWTDMATGAVIAIAELTDIHPAAGCCAPWGEDTYPPANPEGRPPGQVTHLTLEHVVRIRPIPTRGALGLWRPDPDLHLEVAHALAELITWDQANAARLADRSEILPLLAAVRS